MIRKIGSWFVNVYIRLMLGLKPMENTTNFRLFSKKVWDKLEKQKVPWSEKSFLTTPALIYFALKAEPNFVEVPIIFTDRTKGYSKAQLLNYALAIFKFSLKERKETLKTLLRFLAVGFTGMVVNLSSLYLLVEKVGLYKELSSPLAVEISIITNFLLNNYWTFVKRNVEHSVPSRFWKYNVISLIGLAITTTVFLTFTYVFNVHYLLAQFIGIAFATTWNFLASMKWAWKRS